MKTTKPLRLTDLMKPMNLVQNILNKYPLMILDGAFATELEKRGCDLNHSLWSAKVLMESPELISEVHTDYFVAGADCVITSSYQATVEGFIREIVGWARPGLGETPGTHKSAKERTCEQ